MGRTVCRCALSSERHSSENTSELHGKIVWVGEEREERELGIAEIYRSKRRDERR
jgi:hypothetical protein